MITYTVLSLSLFSMLHTIHAGQTESKGKTEQSIFQSQIITPDNDSKTIHITIAPSIQPTFNNSAESNSTSNSIVYSYIETKIQSIVRTIQTITPEQVSGIMTHFFQAYKWHLAIGATASCYLSICVLLFYGNKLMKNQNSWMQWKQHLSVDDLYTTSLDDTKKSELTLNLINTIFSHYVCDTKAPIQSIAPLMAFSKKLNQEIRYINYYIAIAKTLKRTRLMRIFPIDETKIAQAEECKKRLVFIKELFNTWMTTYNVANLLQTFPQKQTIAHAGGYID